MAIDRTPWNALIDDDGSNLIGTIWNKAAIKTVLLDPIDAQITAANWTPTDASGAGLTLPTATGRYWKFDKCVVVQADVGYPSTANALAAKLGGLPFANGPVHGGFSLVYSSITMNVFLGATGTVISFWSPAGAFRSNQELTGAIVRFAGVYLTA